jgi:hypothetical protein
MAAVAFVRGLEVLRWAKLFWARVVFNPTHEAEAGS